MLPIPDFIQFSPLRHSLDLYGWTGRLPGMTYPKASGSEPNLTVRISAAREYKPVSLSLSPS